MIYKKFLDRHRDCKWLFIAHICVIRYVTSHGTLQKIVKMGG